MTFAEKLLRDPELNAYVKNRPAHSYNHPEEKLCLQREHRKNHLEQERLQDRIWYANHRTQCIARTTKRQRYLGFVPMNQPFVGCEGHHINKNDVIYIPRALHKSVQHNVWTGKNMPEINAKACAWMTEDWT